MEVLQIESELASMVKLYKERKPGRILEIGCWDGGTLREWLTHGVPKAEVFAVDLEHRNGGAYDEWRKPGQTLVTHRGDSMHWDAKLFVIANAPYDWVFIDGDHGYEAVCSDVATTRPHVNPGGLMLFHDIVPDNYGSSRVFRELSETHESWEYVDDQDSPYAHGVGVIQL